MEDNTEGTGGILTGIILLLLLYIVAVVSCTIKTFHMISAGDSISAWWWLLYVLLWTPIEIRIAKLFFK